MDECEKRIKRLEVAFDNLCRELKRIGPTRQHETAFELIRQYAAGMLEPRVNA